MAWSQASEKRSLPHYEASGIAHRIVRLAVEYANPVNLGLSTLPIVSTNVAEIINLRAFDV